jgi:predicted O-methyltransferase YrrM
MLRDRHNVDLALSAALCGHDGLRAIHYPVAYVEFLRSCLEHTAHIVTEVKAQSGDADSATKRFATLVDALGSGLPAIEFSVVRDIALMADRNLALSESMEFDNWAGDIGLHFGITSSFGRKGRILFNIIRFMRSERCLELGTAYGMSALFILAALKIYAKSGRLATVEALEPQYSIGASLLKSQYAEMVSSHFGRTVSVFPELVKSPGKIDFMFHDCGHSREDYVRDFEHASEIMAQGAVVLFDDIRWEDPRLFTGNPRTYEGWRAVIGHPRVKRAVEIDGMLGLLLLKWLTSITHNCSSNQESEETTASSTRFEGRRCFPLIRAASLRTVFLWGFGSFG